MRALATTVLVALLIGCGAEREPDGGGGVLQRDSGGTGFEPDTSVGGDDGGAGFDVNDNMDVGKLEPDAACAKVNVAASRPPVDVIVAVDTSGSMQEESTNVQNNINKMSDFLKASGVDYRVVMIATPPNPLFPPPFGPPSICVPPPLGGASCASNPPLYRQVTETIGSTNALAKILSTYDSAGKWNDFIRADAFKAFIIVTDDNATSPTPAPVHLTFDAELLKRGSGTFGTSTARKYIFYPICGAKDSDPTQMCGSGMVNNGQTYVDLAKLTGGRTYELCSTDFGPAFSGVGKGLAAAVACEILVPKPPMGETLDPAKVNVTYTPTSGAPVTIEQDTTKPCEGGANGWQYNADKTKILLCGDICAKLKADTTAKITVELGCATKVKPPM